MAADESTGKPDDPSSATTGVPAFPIDFNSAGLEPLMHAAAPLLAIIGYLRHASGVADIEQLRQRLLDDVRAFEERARASGMPAEQIAAARYGLCAAVDEAILSTPWGVSGEWENRSVLSVFSPGVGGGEKFFQILERALRDVRRYAGLCEVLACCMGLGFRGQPAHEPDGVTRRDQLRRESFEKLRSLATSDDSADLSSHWMGVGEVRVPIFHQVPMWVVGAAALALLTASFDYFRDDLQRRSTPALATLTGVRVQDDFAVESPWGTRSSPSTLKLLLRDLEQQRVLSIEDRVTGTTVMLPRTEVAAADVEVSSDLAATLARVAAALDQVQGPVLVIGHTGQAPIRSFDFQNEFELSTLQAAAVAEHLRRLMQSPSRVQFTGVGSSGPHHLGVARLPEGYIEIAYSAAGERE